MEVDDLDPGAVTEWTTVTDKFRMTAINIGRDGAHVAWERGRLVDGEFEALYAGNVHIQDHEAQDGEPAHPDFTRFMQLDEVQGLVVPMSNFTRANAHDSDLWLGELRALLDTRGI